MALNYAKLFNRRVTPQSRQSRARPRWPTRVVVTRGRWMTGPGWTGS